MQDYEFCASNQNLAQSINDVIVIIRNMLDFDCWLILRIAEWINAIRFDTRLKRIVWLQEKRFII